PPESGDAPRARWRPLAPSERARKNPRAAENPINDAQDAALCAAAPPGSNIDMLAWGGTPPSGNRVRDTAVTKSIADGTDKPVIGFVRMGCVTDRASGKFQNEVGFPFLQGLPSVIRELGALAFYGAGDGGSGRRAAVLPPANGRAETLQGVAFEVALAQHGLTLPKTAMARTPSEAATAAARVGFPVALKIVSSAISHKTEVGGVRLHLTSEAEVERAAHALADTVAKAGAALDGYLVQEMVEGIEMIVGAHSDPLYGPMTVVGAGGILVELVKDVAFRLLPVTPEDARAMIAELKVAK